MKNPTKRRMEMKPLSISGVVVPGNPLLQAILAAQYDTNLYCIYADWLEERGYKESAGWRLLYQYNRFPMRAIHSGHVYWGWTTFKDMSTMVPFHPFMPAVHGPEPPFRAWLPMIVYRYLPAPRYSMRFFKTKERAVCAGAIAFAKAALYGYQPSESDLEVFCHWGLTGIPHTV